MGQWRSSFCESADFSGPSLLDESCFSEAPAGGGFHGAKVSGLIQLTQAPRIHATA